MKNRASLRSKHRFCLTVLMTVVLIAVTGLIEQTSAFDFSRYLFGESSTLFLFVADMNPTTGYVLINGGDSRQPSIPFTWNWGDGVVHDGWFPQSHTYTGLTENYVVTVVAHYSGGTTDSTEIVVRFVPPDVDPIALPPEVDVTIPNSMVTLDTRLYPVPEGLTWFDDGFFDVVPRATAEYVLSLASHIQKDFVNDDVYLIDGGFNQVVLRDPTFGGMYSLWFTDPVSFASGNGGFQGTIEWSSFMHEMGHNYTLNSPAGYYYGGKIDGNANAIYSESMAQIFQHATAYEMINQGEDYGLSIDLITDVKRSAVSSIHLVRNSYDEFVNSGMNFASWNDPGTPWDETFDTFMTIAYEFLAHAETEGMGYRTPVKRMMELLQVFDEDLRESYDQDHNTVEADSFRATLMVTAMSHAFSTDLRSEFESLNFPISHETYDELMGILTGVSENNNARSYDLRLSQNYPNPFNPTTTISFVAPERPRVTLSIHDVQGRTVRTLADETGSGGYQERVWDGRDAAGSPVSSGVYFCRLTAGNRMLTKKMILLR